MKNVVVIGGGTGLSAMMSGFKHLDNVNLTAIITVADDGGSTGRIRDAYNIPAMGTSAMSFAPWQKMMKILCFPR